MKKRGGNVLLTWRFHKYEAVFCCKVFNINTLVYGLLVFSQTMCVLVQHKRKFFIKKVLRKCRKSAVFRNFAGEWRFYTYKAVINSSMGTRTKLRNNKEFCGMVINMMKPSELHISRHITTVGHRC